MSSHHQLPIYRDVYKLIKLIHQITPHFSRNYKYSIGNTLKNESVKLGTNVYKASSRKKIEHIDDLIDGVQVIQMLLRLAVDLKLISINQHAETIQLTAAIGKQAGGWRKSFLPHPVR